MNNLKNEFLLSPGITFLNFGSFGATPKPVMQTYQQLQNEMEADPVDFIAAKLPGYLKRSRAALAAFINCDADDIVYVPNPTYTVNLIAASLGLKPGDEVLATNIEYGACDKSWDYHCTKANAVYKRQPVSLPLENEEAFTDELFKGFNAKTRLVFISHITSTTALKLPVEAVIRKARTLGVPVFVDGAHVPGHIALDIDSLDADYYTGACHKWMMTAKGNTFMYVRRSLQEKLEPLVVSWGYKAMFPSSSIFLDHHQLTGTRDYTPYLTTEAAIGFMAKHDWPTVSLACKQMILEYEERYCRLLGTQPLRKAELSQALQMQSLPVKCPQPEKLHDLFYTDYKIQVPVMRQDDKVYLRYSINGFNDALDIEKFFTAIESIRKKTNLIES